jgi:hypothetical protein
MIFRFHKNSVGGEKNVRNNYVSGSCILENALSYTSDFYPNISRIMQLLLCLTVGTCCCERSFLALRRLITWMTQSRLCGLSMLHIHRSDTVSEINATSVPKKNGMHMGF